MSENELRKLPGEHETIISLLQYRPPVVAPEDFRTHLQEHLLGLFIDPVSTGSMQSIVSVGGDSFSTEHTARSVRSIEEEQQEELIRGTLISPNLTLEIVSKTSLKRFEGTKMKIFSSVLFQGNSMWICGWNRNVVGNNDVVLLNVEVPDYKVLLKKKKRYKNSELPTIMFSHKDSILFAKRGGNEIFDFNTQTHRFKRLASFADLAVAAMCGAEEVYYLDSKNPEHIQILDSSRVGGIIPTGLGKVKAFPMDMCLVRESSTLPSSTDIHSGNEDHTIILSVSAPHASVRAVNHTHGVLWQIDCRSRPDQLNLEFNPCSVSSTTSGNIFVADQGTDRVKSSLVFPRLFI